MGKISKILRGGNCGVGDTFPKVSNFWKGIFLQISFHNAEKQKPLLPQQRRYFLKRATSEKSVGRASTSWATHCFTSKAGLEPATRFCISSYVVEVSLLYGTFFIF
jgi:hypothetical protein